MLSIRLVQLVAAHWEEIAKRVSAQLRQNPETPTLAQRPDAELTAWCRDLLENMETLLGTRREEQFQRLLRIEGQRRYEEHIPLHEAVMRLQILKAEIFNFIHEQGFAMTILELYREEELQALAGRFFDGCVYQLVRGYEDAMRVAARVA